jgi:cell division protein FtsW (lipid II flippase)
MDKEKLKRLKVHIIFGGGLTLLFLVGVILKITSGERLLQASWNSFKEIRPVEWMMILLFWYSAAFHKPRDEWSSNSMTTLGLSEKR